MPKAGVRRLQYFSLKAHTRREADYTMRETDEVINRLDTDKRIGTDTNDRRPFLSVCPFTHPLIAIRLSVYPSVDRHPFTKSRRFALQ
ncbi:MAG TPA: hypothetical protein VIK33_14805 [Anaerolineae bacterium]